MPDEPEERVQEGTPRDVARDVARDEVFHVDLPGGRRLTVRPIEPGDVAGLQLLFAGLSSDEVYERFFSGHPPNSSFIEEMTTVAERGGCGLVAVVDTPDGATRLVAEASYSPLASGNAELGITVAQGARGWLGPYLVDALARRAHAAGISNLEAVVLFGNRPMLAVLAARGAAFLDADDHPALFRLLMGTAGRLPVWPPANGRPRLLVETRSGPWSGTQAARNAGFTVLSCPGAAREPATCPALAGRPCPLAATADVILDWVPGQPGYQLSEAHRRLHPGVPRLGPMAIDADGPDTPHVDPPTDVAGMIELLSRLARRRASL